MCNFGRGYQEEEFCEFTLNFGYWFRSCRLKDFLSGALAALLFSGAKPFMQFEWRYHGEHSCEVIWSLDQWFRRRCHLKIFLIWSSGGPFVQWSGTILVEGIKFGRGYQEKQFCEIRTSDSLNEGLPIKMTREKLQRKWYFFYEKDSRFNPRLIHKSRFVIGQVPIEKYGLKAQFLLFNI